MIEFNSEKYVEEIKKLDEVLDKHFGKEGALMPVLQATQDLFGYLPKEMLERISRRMQIPIARIYGVATFYAQFSFVPIGKYKISVCMGTACYVKGSKTVLDEIKEELGINTGETTSDGLFTLVETRCIGACGLAPVMTINEEVHGRLVSGDAKKILSQYK